MVVLGRRTGARVRTTCLAADRAQLRRVIRNMLIDWQLEMLVGGGSGMNDNNLEYISLDSLHPENHVHVSNRIPKRSAPIGRFHAKPDGSIPIYLLVACTHSLDRLVLNLCYIPQTHEMASTKPVTMLVARSRPAVRLSQSSLISRPFASPAIASLSSSAFRAATPAGPPPQGFRLPRKERWDEGKETSLDKAGKYFLLAEMFRGMYVVLEQFFRPP